MILDVLDAELTELEDATAGLNAKVAQVNTAKSAILAARSVASAPDVREILLWNQSKGPGDMRTPTLLVLPEGGWDLELTSQAKWRGRHRVNWQLWIKERATAQARVDVLIYLHAMRNVIDLLAKEDGSGVIQEIEDVAYDLSGWKDGDRYFTVIDMAHTVVERDENP